MIFFSYGNYNEFNLSSVGCSDNYGSKDITNHKQGHVDIISSKPNINLTNQNRQIISKYENSNYTQSVCTV